MGCKEEKLASKAGKSGPTEWEFGAAEGKTDSKEGEIDSFEGEIDLIEEEIESIEGEIDSKEGKLELAERKFSTTFATFLTARLFVIFSSVDISKGQSERECLMRAAILAGIVSALGVSALKAAPYTFENLNLNASLSGQDSWVPDPIIAGSPASVRTIPGADPTKVALVGQPFEPSGVYRATRVNNGAYSFSPLSSTLVNAIEFDALWGNDGQNNSSATFSLGRDLDGNGIISAAGEQGPLFGMTGGLAPPPGGPGGFFFRIVDAAGGTQHLATLPASIQSGEWVRLRLLIDPSANAGDGSASLQYRNISDGEITFTAVPGLQNINVHLLSMDPAANSPDEWNAMWFRTDAGGGNSVSAVDNLSTSVVPEPTMLGGAMILAAALARKRQRWHQHR